MNPANSSGIIDARIQRRDEGAWVNAETSADAAKYWAFISYSHRDSKTASAVQRALETYRIPKRLVGIESKAGKVPTALKPIFRDRDEMQAGADLNATVKVALSQSRFLVVVCSPEATRSTWVNQEIIEFKKLHGESRVLALIAGGEPFASNMPGREAEECFPQALRFALDSSGEAKGPALEPIAADLRPQGDGKRLAVLKLVAGMVGVGVDELVQRDAQRRARRLAYVTSGAVAGMAVMAVLTAMAVQSRIEAQSQRAQAEDLIEFMLGDLRKKLDPVGRLDVLDSVGEKALGYYAKQDADKLDANALGRRSRAMHLIGEMRDRRGKFNEALSAFKSAQDTTLELLTRTPNDGQRVFDHAQSVYWVGYIAWRQGQANAAEQAFRRYRELAERLTQIDATNVDWQLETTYANQNLGVVQLENSRAAEALASFNDMKVVLTRLLPVKPELVFELAEAYGWVAKSLEAKGDYRAAIDAQQLRLKLLLSTLESNKNLQAQHQLANANSELARLFSDLGEIATAEEFAHKAVQLSKFLVASDSANMFWLSELCFHSFTLSEIELANGKRDYAEKTFFATLVHLKQLLRVDGPALIWQIKLKGRSLALEAQFSKLRNQREMAKELESYIGSVADFEASGKYLTAEQREIVATVELELGDLLQRLGNPIAAQGVWRLAISRFERTNTVTNYPLLTLLARLNLRAREIARARVITKAIQASDYRHPAYATLVKEINLVAGQGQPVDTKRRV